MKSARNGYHPVEKAPRIPHHPRVGARTRDASGLENNLDIHVRLDRDRGDLLHGLGGGVQVDDALVHSHLPAVPGVGALTARGLAHSQAQHLGGHAHGAAHLETLLITGTPDQVGANLPAPTLQPLLSLQSLLSLSLALALPRPLSPSSHFPLPSLLPHGRCASRALAQSARLPTGHPRLLVHCAVCCPSAAGTCMPTLRPYLLKALTFSRLATDLEVVRVMRILDSAPVASPSTCTPSRVSPAVAAICWWWARDEGPRTHRAEAWGGVALLVARVRPQHRWLSFRTHALLAHMQALGLDGSTELPAPRERATHARSMRAAFWRLIARQAWPLGATAHLLSKTGHRAARSTVPKVYLVLAKKKHTRTKSWSRP